MKRAADRIKAQVELLGNKEYPLTFDRSENSYDAGGNPDPYNANISAVAYRIMAELSAETGESDKAAEYAEACKTMVKSFADRYIRGRDPMTGKHCENVFSGQELAYHLRLGQMWSQAETDSVISRLNHFYYPCYWGGWAIPKAPTTSGRPTCSYTTAGCCYTPGASTNGWPCRKTPT